MGAPREVTPKMRTPNTTRLNEVQDFKARIPNAGCARRAPKPRRAPSTGAPGTRIINPKTFTTKPKKSRRKSVAGKLGLLRLLGVWGDTAPARLNRLARRLDTPPLSRFRENQISCKLSNRFQMSTRTASTVGLSQSQPNTKSIERFRVRRGCTSQRLS